MRRQDVRAGEVYAYANGRPQFYTHYNAVLVLSTDKHRARDGRLVPEDSLPMQSGAFRRSSVGLPSVTIRIYDLREGETVESRISRARELASLAKYSWQGAITDDDDASTVLGTYQLVTSCAVLHGLYSEVVAVQRENEILRARAARQEQERKDRNRADYQALYQRAGNLGITFSHRYNDYTAARSVTLTFDELSALLAEGGAPDSRGEGEDRQ
jgi:hypothetical protein